MEKINKKHYVAPSMKVYETEPTQILTGSTKVSVSSWSYGESLGSGEMEEDWDLLNQTTFGIYFKPQRLRDIEYFSNERE